MHATSRQDEGIDSGRTDEPAQEATGETSGDLSQQDEDARRQSELTRGVGVTLTTPEKATASRWRFLSRLGRIGRDERAPTRSPGGSS